MLERKYPTIGACGLDCGLCTAFYTEGISRCPGCCGPEFSSKHPSCGIITCCVKEHGLEICCDCPDFPCKRYKDTGKADSFITYRNVMKNFNFIREHGIQKYTDMQKQRMACLKTMLDHYNDGRSKSFYCLACTLLSYDKLKQSMADADRLIKENTGADAKTRAKLLKDILKRAAMEENVELKLRKV
jgi:hypothetical protein